MQNKKKNKKLFSQESLSKIISIASYVGVDRPSPSREETINKNGLLPGDSSTFIQHQEKPLHYDPNLHSYVEEDIEQSQSYVSTMKDILKSGLRKFIPGVGLVALLTSCGPEPVQEYATYDADSDGHLDKILFLESDHKRALGFYNLQNGLYELSVMINVPRHIRELPTQDYDVNNQKDDDLKDYVLYKTNNSSDVLQSITTPDSTKSRVENPILYKLVNVNLEQEGDTK